MQNYIMTLPGFSADFNENQNYLKSEDDVFLNPEDLGGEALFKATAANCLWKYLPKR